MTHPMVVQLSEALQQVADLEKAGGMQAYMKTEQPFYGVQAGPRRKLFKAVARGFKQISREEYEQIIIELWRGTYREDMYQALEVAEHYKAYRDKQSWPIYEQLVRTASNWDTLDWVAGKLISPLVLQHRELEEKLVAWAQDENFWVRRASLLAHLHHKEQTNTRLLAEIILRLSQEPEFFIRKAIGWVLRDYSYTDPDWVLAFVGAHQEELSGLSKREAMKQIKRSGSSRKA
jgi:3-methyladenine DNA glycosylase AlkD